MASVVNAVKFIDQPVTLSDELKRDKYQCFCMNDSNRDYYIVHEGANGKQHPYHLGCVKEWLKGNHKNCPGCRVPISNTLETRVEKIATDTKRAATHAALGGKHVENDYVFGAVALATIAAIEFSGMRGIKNVLAILGVSYGLAMIVGYWNGRGPESGAEERISISPLGAMVGCAVGLLAWCTGHNEESTLAQMIAIGVLMKTVGYRPLVLSTAIGALSSGFVGRTFQFAKDYAPAIGGALGALVNVKDAPWFISGLSLRSGFAMGSLASIALRSFGEYSPIAAGAIGAGSAAIASILLTRGYRAFKT